MGNITNFQAVRQISESLFAGCCKSVFIFIFFTSIYFLFLFLFLAIHEAPQQKYSKTNSDETGKKSIQTQFGCNNLSYFNSCGKLSFFPSFLHFLNVERRNINPVAGQCLLFTLKFQPFNGSCYLTKMAVYFLQDVCSCLSH